MVDIKWKEGCWLATTPEKKKNGKSMHPYALPRAWIGYDPSFVECAFARDGNGIEDEFGRRGILRLHRYLNLPDP